MRKIGLIYGEELLTETITEKVHQVEKKEAEPEKPEAE